MKTQIEKNQDIVLQYLYKREVETEGETYSKGEEIHSQTGLKSVHINDAIDLLNNSGLVEVRRSIGTEPYKFYAVKITARGKYEVQREKSLRDSAKVPKSIPAKAFARYLAMAQTIKPPAPIGSPYGFTDVDWELVSSRKANRNVLYVVLGCKFESSQYDTEELRKNVENMFGEAVKRYNKENHGESISLSFVPLHAGYGEHVFNEIARDIISSDIAVFETSDLTPNVFVEIGVALTWGSRVFLIKRKGRASPPSDISGHTYADYLNDAKTFVDIEHEEKLYRMVERAIRKKG